MNKPLLNMNQKYVSRNNFVEDMLELTDCMFDKGDTPEFANKEAVEAGFDNNVAFYCSKALRVQEGNLQQMITAVLQDYYVGNINCVEFLHSQYPIDEDSSIVSIAYISKKAASE